MTRKKMVMILAGLLILAYGGVAIYQSRKPDLPLYSEDSGALPGFAMVSMVSRLMETQLDGPGGWVPNDLPVSPSFILDNLTNFQLGVLQTVRHSSRVIRDNLTRQRTSDPVHKETDIAYSFYANNPLTWTFPSAEGQFGKGNAALDRFVGDLGGQSGFYPRADNLIQLLEQYISELGAVASLLLDANTSKVGWLQIDDNFYYAQGVAFAMYGVMQAVRHDFRQVINDKNAGEISELILHSLKESQFDPLLVTNGSKDGLMANHSNNLKVFLDDARQKMKSLVAILDQG